MRQEPSNLVVTWGPRRRIDRDSMVAPGDNDPICRGDTTLDGGVVVDAHRVRMSSEHLWGRAAQGEEIDHHGRSEPPETGETDDPSRRRVIERFGRS